MQRPAGRGGDGPHRDAEDGFDSAADAAGERGLRVRDGPTTYGAIGVKVWIYLGKFGEEVVPARRARRSQPGRGSAAGTVR